ncbi:MAG: hypothetical protein HOL01_03575 [Planctomycetaceae bacterium]|nr:hypothetical protein [Planctomycetaceae bacterium]MBT6486929.1 hypothetical protein [Planctomycetaceae bacterium]MBT6493613.1 hypothetical protein [Planctomycetaceae bacterium]
MEEHHVAFCQPVCDLRKLSAAEFLQALSWESDAPKSLVSAAAGGKVNRFYRTLQKRGFGTVTSANACVVGVKSPANGEPPKDAERTATLIELLDTIITAKPKHVTGRHAHELSAWLDETLAGEQPTVIELQLLLEVLRREGSQLPLDVFGALWRLTLTESLQLSAELDESRGSQASDSERLMFQGELPWQVGLLFSDVGGAEVLREFGRQHLSEQLEDRTDTDGTPQADLLHELELWLAPLVRAIHWGRAFSNRLWNEEETKRFRELTATTISLCGADGRLPFHNDKSGSAVTLLSSAAKTAGWKKQSQPRRYLQSITDKTRASGGKQKNAIQVGKQAKYPVVQSDWARLASLRTGWQPNADMLLVAHHGEMPLIDLTANGQRLLNGTWDIELTIDSEPLEFVNQWTCTCWHSDKDADYVELQLSFENGIQVERQLLLSRTDRYAVLADVVSGAGDSRIEYSSTLPVVEGLEIEADVPSRECRIGRKGLRVRAFPLALPDDRVMSAAGSFSAVNENAAGGIELKQVGVGGLYAPLILDWHKKRRRQEADWRTVTVSERGEIQKTEAASGHRLRIGNHQLLLYRSLQQPTIPRAVLGQHTSNETLIGQFDNAGDVTPILIVE